MNNVSRFFFLIVLSSFGCQNVFGQLPGRLSSGQVRTYYSLEIQLGSVYSIDKATVLDASTGRRGNSGLILKKLFNTQEERSYEIYDAYGVIVTPGRVLDLSLADPQIAIASDSSIWIVGWLAGKIYFSKSDFSANLIFEKEIQGFSGYGDLEVVADTSGNVYVLGEDHLYKIDPSGNVLWGKTFVSSSWNSTLQMSYQNQLYVHIDSRFVRLDLNGNVISAFNISPGNHVTITPENNIYLANGEFVNLFDSLGNKQWHTQLVLQGGTISGIAANYKTGGAQVITTTPWTVSGNLPGCPSNSTTIMKVTNVDSDGQVSMASTPVASHFDKFDLRGFSNSPNGEVMIFGSNTYHATVLSPCIVPLQETGIFQKFSQQEVCYAIASPAYNFYPVPGALIPLTVVPSVLTVTTSSVTVNNPPQSAWVRPNRSCLRCPAPDLASSISVNGFTAIAADTACNYYTIWRAHGDGQVDSSMNTVHQYSATGIYNSCLIAENQCGIDSFCTRVSICTSPPLTQFAFLKNNLVVSFFDSTANATQWFWDFGDGILDSVQNPSHLYSSCGTYLVTLITGNPCGFDTVSQNIFVPFQAVNLGPDTTICSNDSIVIEVGQGFTATAWSTGDTTPSILVNSPGTYSVEVIDSMGCKTMDTIEVFTVTAPTAQFSSIINQLSANFTNVSPSTLSWLWSFGDGSLDSTPNPTHTYQQPGTYQVCLSAYGATGCFDSYCDSVSIPIPTGILPQGLRAGIIYPNPSSGVFYIRFHRSILNETSIQIRNALGTIVLSQKISPDSGLIVEVPISSLPNGVYQVQMGNSDLGTIMLNQ